MPSSAKMVQTGNPKCLFLQYIRSDCLKMQGNEPYIQDSDLPAVPSASQMWMDFICPGEGLGTGEGVLTGLKKLFSYI